VLLAFPIAAGVAAGTAQSGRATPLDTPPSALPLATYEADVLYPWLEAREYAHLGWTVDSHVRDTGPFVQGHYYGTHPAVRLYYSPAVREWLDGGREGEVPTGGIIVKEQFTPPAAIYRTLEESGWFREHPDRYEALLDRLLIGWSGMIKDPGGGSKDGWFWSSPGGSSGLRGLSRPCSDGHAATAGAAVVLVIASARQRRTFVRVRHGGAMIGVHRRTGRGGNRAQRRQQQHRGEQAAAQGGQAAQPASSGIPHHPATIPPGAGRTTVTGSVPSEGVDRAGVDHAARLRDLPRKTSAKSWPKICVVTAMN